MQTNKQAPLIIELVEELWKKQPELRFFQLIHNLQYQLGNKSGDLHYMDDTDIIKQLTNRLGSDII